MRIALYQPDIPQNTGTILRLAACLEIAVDIIGPAGFDLSDRALRRAGLDYLAHAAVVRHRSWDEFVAAQKTRDGAIVTDAKASRLVLFTTKSSHRYTDFAFSSGDILVFGRESAGVPDHVHGAADARLFIPIKPGLRSLNVAVSVAMAAGEALRQTGGFPAASP